MKFSAQEEYGLRCLITIAVQKAGSPLTIPEIALAEGLSQPYVGKLLSHLRKSGFIKSTRGQFGGYTLDRQPSEILVSDILESLGGRLYDESFCHRHTGLQVVCSHSMKCMLMPLWTRLQTAVDQALIGITLEDLIGKK